MSPPATLTPPWRAFRGEPIAQEGIRMLIRRRSVTKRALATVGAAVLGLGLVTAVLAQGAAVAGKSEVTDIDKSWPHEVRAPDGRTMATLLTEIHDKALDEWAAATPETRVALRAAISRSM